MPKAMVATMMGVSPALGARNPQMLQGAQAHRFPTLRASLPTLLPGVSPERLRNGEMELGKHVFFRFKACEFGRSKYHVKLPKAMPCPFPVVFFLYNSYLLVFPIHSVHSAIK